MQYCMKCCPPAHIIFSLCALYDYRPDTSREGDQVSQADILPAIEPHFTWHDPTDTNIYCEIGWDNPAYGLYSYIY